MNSNSLIGEGQVTGCSRISFTTLAERKQFCIVSNVSCVSHCVISVHLLLHVIQGFFYATSHFHSTPAKCQVLLFDCEIL